MQKVQYARTSLPIKMPQIFSEKLAQHASQIDTTLDHLLPESNALSAAMRHGVLAGGKRLRGFLVLETAALFDIDPQAATQGAAAIECLHAYSLVHDDLPAMDNDDLRRGLPTVHVKWDEATAILTGDALQSLAFEVLSNLNLPATARIDLVRTLALASGRDGMVLGQAMDLAAESATTPLNLDAITALQARKTGALIDWSARFGARASQTPDDDPRHVALAHYAAAIGLAFQIWDDVLDIESDTATLGKTVGKDVRAGKATFASHLGIEGAKRAARDEITRAEHCLAPFGNHADTLRHLANFIITRQF